MGNKYICLTMSNEHAPKYVTKILVILQFVFYQNEYKNYINWLVLRFYNKNKDGWNVSQLVVAWLFCELQWSINDIYAYVYIFSNAYFEHYLLAAILKITLAWWQIKEFYWMYYIFCDGSNHRETPLVAFTTWNE